MTPSNFTGANIRLTKPHSMTDEECGVLIAFSDGDQYISCWKMSWRERLRVLFSGVVWLHILSKQHPPVLIRADLPHQSFRPKKGVLWSEPSSS